jgi:glycosyltransferase involved in cell wall biosynthesis
MKLVVYLPALNESATVGAVLDSIPTSIPGIDEIERIVVDDGSTDETSAIAIAHGASVVRHDHNLGTGKTFISGVGAALSAEADIIVSMDADGQFAGADIEALIAPIRDGHADVSLCSRFKADTLVGDLPPFKRGGNILLTRIISIITKTPFTDVSCGFRALSREAALRVEIYSNFEYIHESLLNWSRHGLRIKEVALPVLAERPVGQSRIMASIFRYALRSGPVLLRAIRDHNPMKFFGLLSLITLLPSCMAGVFITVHWWRTNGTAPYTSLVTLTVGGILLSLLLGVVALLADLIGRVRLQLERLVYDSRVAQFERISARRRFAAGKPVRPVDAQASSPRVAHDVSLPA